MVDPYFCMSIFVIISMPVKQLVFSSSLMTYVNLKDAQGHNLETIQCVNATHWGRGGGLAEDPGLGPRGN